jgi:autotransporter-associated beta strand protein
MKTHLQSRASLPVIRLALLLAFSSAALAYSPKPDLTVSGAIATLKGDSNSSPVYSETYNLGPTGLRGWIYIDRNNTGNEGLITAQSRQILVTVASSPGSAVLAVDDVILGAMAGNTGVVPLFPGDCRKAFGAAIGDAEKTAAGTLRVKRWRAGTTTDENIAMTVMGDYTATAPYNCLKSELILANAITKLNQQSLTGGWDHAVSGLALLAAVKPGDANYTSVQTKLRTFARALAPANLSLAGNSCDTWNWGYINIFLSEYYLRTAADGNPDANVLHGIEEYTVNLAKHQSKYGTFGHGGAEQHADGSLHGSISWYGPVNSAGLAGNLGIVLGRKALVAGAIALDPEIDPAIERGSRFFAYYVNKGGIPYGEHEPWSGGHASNGKDAMAAVMFALQDNKPVETEYYTRMSVAGWVGREYGHTGQGFSYLWAALGAGMGGDAAAAAHLNQVRWHLDLERRTDGSFVYDGGEQYGGSSTATYLGSSSYSGLNPNACFVLTYALPLKRIYITGRNALLANTLDAAKVSNAVAAATYERDCVNYSVATLMAALSEYDPVVRHDAAAELGKDPLSTADVNALIALITNGTMSADANVRQGACEALGIRKATGALTALGQRLSDTDQWVRGKAANALRNFGAGASSQLTPMLTAFTANATDPNVIVWDDPIQIANGYLADTLFTDLATTTNALTGTARTSLLYPALRAGLKQPDGMARMYLGDFIKNRLTLTDVQAVAPSLVAAVAERSPADRMFSDVIRYAALNTLGKYKIEEGIPLCLMLKEQTWHGDDWDPFTLLQNTYRGAAKDALPTLYKWRDHIPQFAADGSIGGCCQDRLTNITNKIASTIASIENDAAPPALVYLKTLNASASPPSFNLPTTQTVLTSSMTDLDGGTPNFAWSKVSGPGSVSFSPNGMTDDTHCTATFDTPGTYVLRVTAVDRSILDYNTWITYNLGYFDFQTYEEILGGVTANVTIVVGQNMNRAPVPQNQSLATPLNSAAAVTLEATDPNGDPMTYGVIAQPSHGTLSGSAPNLTYTPTAGFTGPDSFTFKANDGMVDSQPATVTIDVGVAGNRRPMAVNQYVTTPEEIAKAITLTGSDPDNDTLVYEIVSGPAHGTFSGTAPNLTYQPSANYPAGNLPAQDVFTFTVRDGSLTSALATVSLTVTPVNDAPQAIAQSVTVSVNTANPITLAGSDAEGYPLPYAIVANPGHGTLSGTAPDLTYTPAANYHGADSFTFRVTDSEGVPSATATVGVTIINDPPVANPQSVELPPNTIKALTLTGSDNCNDPLAYTVLTQPAHGVLSGSPPNVTYTPAANYTGSDSFTFKVNDGVFNSPPALVSLNVAQWQTWTNIASGTWSTGSQWSGAAAPAAGGGTDALLVYNTSGYSGASSNDFAGTFQLNRLNLGSALPALTISGNPLSFSANSATLPQMNQNSANPVTISNSLALAANTTLGGSGGGGVTLSGVISGAGALTKSTGGDLSLTRVNTHAGGTTVNSGSISISTKNSCGTGTLSLAGGGGFTTGFEGNSSGGALPNPIVLTGGMVTCDVSFGGKDIWTNTVISGPGGFVISGNGRSQGFTFQGNNTFQGGVTLGEPGSADRPNAQLFNVNSLGTGTLRTELVSADLSGGGLRIQADLSAGVANPIHLVTGARLVVNTNPDGTARTVKFTGPVAGGGSLVKTGTGSMTLTGSATYTGATKVIGGTLTCANAYSLGQGALAISSGAKVTLNFTGTRHVTSLSLAGVAQPYGIYGLSGFPTYFSGNGTVTVAPPTSTTLDLTTGTATSIQSSPLTFTATVTGTAPTGNVAFYAGTTWLGTGPLNGSFQASVTSSSIAAGSQNITAQYSGDSGNGTSTSAVLVIQVIGLPAAPANLAATAGSNTVSLTWSPSAGSTGYLVKRSLTGGGPYLVIGSPGANSYNDVTAVNGTNYFYVVSATNTAGEGAASAQVTALPAPTQSTTTLASSLGAAGAYGSVTFTATVAAAGGPAGGTVTFRDGATVLGTGTLSSGSAAFATTSLALGGHSITASYEGNSTFAPSVCAGFSYTVNAKAVTITGVTAGNKIYDGTTTANLTGGAVSGVLAGESVTAVAGGGTFSSANVGSRTVATTGYSLGGAHAGNYLLSAQPVVANATITARPLQIAGTRAYDATTAAAAGILSIANNLDGENLILTGSAQLAARNVGAQAVTATSETPVRIQKATGTTGTDPATTISVIMPAAPTAGSMMVAVISTRGTTANTVTSITQTGVPNGTWVRAAQSNISIMTTEIWYAPNLPAGAGTAITINQLSVRSGAVVMEYSGIASSSPLDQIPSAVSSGNSTAAVTGITAATTQSSELWIGGIGYNHSTRTLGSILNSFALVDFATSTHPTTGNNARVHALERMVTATAAASSGGTISAQQQWTGTIATFKAAPSLVLSGSAAANYTLNGATGAVQITPKVLAITPPVIASKVYNATSAAGAVTAGTLAGFVGTETVTTTASAAAYSGPDVGSYPGGVITYALANGTNGGLAANYSLSSGTAEGTITARTLTLTAVTATKIYDGTTTAPGTPDLSQPLFAGDSATVLSQSFQDPNTGTGKVLVPFITISDGNSGNNYAVTVVNNNTGVIGKAPATITLGDLTHTYDGFQKIPSVTTEPSGRSFSLTYNNLSTAPFDADSYAVVATITDPNYTGTTSATMVIVADLITSWRSSHFAAEEIAVGLAADDDDPEGDGFTNLDEYTLGTDPRTFTPRPLVLASTAGNSFTLTFVARAAAGSGYMGLTRKYDLVVSSDPSTPGSWQGVSGHTQMLGGGQTVIVTLPIDAPKKFYRLSVRLE